MYYKDMPDIHLHPIVLNLSYSGESEALTTVTTITVDHSMSEGGQPTRVNSRSYSHIVICYG